jgi:Arc/MetJ-type ribon-helix-helix transcriptional regulator
MNVTLSPQTQKLLEERMKEGDYASPDDIIRVALETLEGEAIEDLDPQTLEAIDRAEAQAERGEGISIDQARAELRRKHPGL